MNAPEFLVGVVAGVLAVALLHVLFAHQEVYFAWLVPVFLVGIPIAMFTYGGSPMAAGALTGLAAGACVFGRRSVLLSRGHQVRLETLARELGLSFAREDQTFADAAMWIADDVGRCSNVLSGPWHGTPVAVFQYTYLDTSDGEAPAAIQLTCAASILDADLPRMLV